MSKKIYVIAQFKPKSGKADELFNILKTLEFDSQREDGCLRYTLTRQIEHPLASLTEYSIVYHEIWADAEAWSAHGRRKQVQDMFASQVEAESGLVEDVIVTSYTDEGPDFDAPVY